MAKRKKKRSTGRGLSSGRTRSVKHVRRRRKKRGMLSEFLSSDGGQSAGKAVLSGAVGGAASVVVDYIIPDDQPPIYKGLAKMGLGWAMAKFGGMRNVGAGMAGAGAADLMQTALGLSEGGGSANYAAPIQALPAFLSESGEPLSEKQGRYLMQGPGTNPGTPKYLPGYVPSYM